MFTRVIIETQSNALFRGEESEQVYDQRGGLCQVGEGHIVVTTNPIDEIYLRYWEGLGFTLPTFIQAGPFDSAYTLSELIARKPAVQKAICSAVNGLPARIELFWVAECDVELSCILNMPIYCNPNTSIQYACKYRFKQLCDQLGLSTAPWVGGYSIEKVIEMYQQSDFAGCPVLVKATNSTGGISLGAIKHFTSSANLAGNKSTILAMEFPLVIERIVSVVAEVTVHWEIDEQDQIRIIGIFDQLSENYSFAGAAFPTLLSMSLQRQIREDLIDTLAPALIDIGARGFFCCDILVQDDETVLWTDFNPRKGAILYVYDMVNRLSVACMQGNTGSHVWHEHTKLPNAVSFQHIHEVLSDLLRPSSNEAFVVVTNPGIIPYGGVDLTGISFTGREAARCVVNDAKKLLTTTHG